VSPTAQKTRHTVTAVIVAHDGAEVLPALVRGLASQTHQVERVVGIDTGSRDGSDRLLSHLIGEERVFTMDRDTGFGEAVAMGLRHHAASRRLHTDQDLRRVEWIWLLHDDCEPATDALERLLRAATRDRTVAVLGPKVADGTDRKSLRETGIAIDRAGRRVTGIERGERDQGQHDGERGVLAVGSAGMLIRRDVWEQLGGFDSRLKLFRDDLDFCWRVHGAGYRVRVVTDAVVYHRELSARNVRVDRARVQRLDRRNALYVLAVNLPFLPMLSVLSGCLAGSLGRILWFLVSKQKDLAAAEGYALGWLASNPIPLWKARRRRKAGRDTAYKSVRALIPPSRPLNKLAEATVTLLSSTPQVTGGRHQALNAIDEEEDQFADQSTLIRRVLANTGVQVVLALLIVSLVAERRLLSGAGPLGGGALVPAVGSASALWSQYVAGFHAAGLGSAASAPPYTAIVAALATILLGHPWLAVDVLLLGSVPLAGLTAYLAAGRLVTSKVARAVLAFSYALLPAATGAVAAGHLGASVAFAMIPLIAVTGGRMLTAPPRNARRAAWATGLLVALTAAFSPLVWVLALVFAISALLVRRRLWPVSRVDAAIVVVTPIAALFPWSLHLFASPSAFLADVGVRTVTTGSSLSPASLLALSPGGSGLPPLWVTAGLLLAVLSLVLPHGRGRLLGTGWTIAAAGYLAAIAVSRTTSAGDSGWPGTALAVTAAGLLAAAAPAAQWLADQWHAEGRRRVLKTAARLTLTAAATAPVLVAVFWAGAGVRGPVSPVGQSVLPAFVAASSTSGTQYRTLVLRPDGATTNYTVLRSSDPILGEPELTDSGAADQALSRQVSALVAPDGADSGDPGQELASFGVRWVLLPAPVSQTLADRLDGASGLVPVSTAPSYDLWQVTGTVSRVRVVAPTGTVTSVASQTVGVSGARVPAAGGKLIVAEPYGGWTAKLNGTALKPLSAPVDGWEQGFTLPAGGGTLTLTRNNLARTISLWAELVALLAVIVLALPGKREDPAAAAEAIAAVRAAQETRRLARAARTRELTRAAATRLAESKIAQRTVSGLATSHVAGAVGRGAMLTGHVVETASRAGRGKTAVAPARQPLALPAAPADRPLGPDASSVVFSEVLDASDAPAPVAPWDMPESETGDSSRSAPPWDDDAYADSTPGGTAPISAFSTGPSLVISTGPLPAASDRTDRHSHRGGRHGKPGRRRRKDSDKRSRSDKDTDGGS
jgi:GT2 family glycosyltransferase